MKKNFFAREVDGHYQNLVDHLKNVGDGMAERVPELFKAIAYQTGLLHDLGKYNPKWQSYLLGKTKKQINHATQGALAAFLWNDGVEADVCLPIQAHHSQLNNYQELNLEHKEFDEETLYTEITNFGDELYPLLDSNNLNIDTIPEIDKYLAAKMLYSALVDADSLDAQYFAEAAKTDKLPKNKQFVRNWKLILSNKMVFNSLHTEYTSGDPVRDKFFLLTNTAASKPKGLYSLTGPTGVGKFQSSLNFALKHTIEHNMDGFIYVAPYLSILQQAASNCQKILGNEDYEKFVLEHHSSYEPKDDAKFRQLCARWDAPIILTSGVQFLETLFSNRRGRNRKLHQLMNRVIIIDEVQTIPKDVLIPTLLLLESLVKYWGATVLLTTATQPSAKYIKDSVLERVTPLLKPEDTDYFFRQRQTCNYKHIGMTDWDGINEIIQEKRSLIICETANHVQEGFPILFAKQENLVCLNARMCGVHRDEVLQKIKAGNVSVLATRVVEAGVDLDFPLVLREDRLGTGLDSIVQAAGRCNREMKIAHLGQLLIFKFKNAETNVQRYMQEHDFNKPESLLAAIKQYFDEDNVKITNKTEHILKAMTGRQYKTVDELIEIIGDEYTSVIVPYNNDAKELIAKPELSRSDWRKLQKYSASVPRYWVYRENYPDLKHTSNIEIAPNGVILWKGNYCNNVGCLNRN
ncbi:MAG: CRISPR-associated endonuclease Cas3'' [Trichodesmium sp.]